MTLTRSILSGLALTTMLGLAQTANAAIMHFSVPLSGAQEVVMGDSDGMGIANLYIDDVALTIDWNITVSDILLPLSGAHIHAAAAGANGPLVVNFNAQLTGTNLADMDLASILANPSDYYINLHNTEFPTGALRGQMSAAAVPEPTTLALLGLGIAGLLWRRRTPASV